MWPGSLPPPPSDCWTRSNLRQPGCGHGCAAAPNPKPHHRHPPRRPNPTNSSTSNRNSSALPRLIAEARWSSSRGVHGCPSARSRVTFARTGSGMSGFGGHGPAASIGHGDHSSHTRHGGQGRETDPVLGDLRSGPCDPPTWLLVSNRAESAPAGLHWTNSPALTSGQGRPTPLREKLWLRRGCLGAQGNSYAFSNGTHQNRRPRSQRFATEEMRRKT
jgi:hypothetical protein